MVDLRKAARDQPCSVRWDGCDGGGETSVLAHIRSPGTGMGKKPSDYSAVIACFSCHNAIDNRARVIPPEDRDTVILGALLRTHEHWNRLGILDGS